MHDFGPLVYMDIQKTGSTFVSAFLKEACLLEEQGKTKHGTMHGKYNPESFYFISVREPVSCYTSLFRYGLDKRGGFFKALRKAGFKSLYQDDSASFNKWIEFVSSPENAEILGNKYEKVHDSVGLGLLSYRIFILSVEQPYKKLANIDTYDKLMSVYERNNIIKHVVKNESLNADLMDLSTVILPQYFDQEKVDLFLNKKEKINTSTPKPEGYQLDEQVRQLIKQRERLLYTFYPDANI